MEAHARHGPLALDGTSRGGTADPRHFALPIRRLVGNILAMTWSEAKQRILETVREGDRLSKTSRFRQVEKKSESDGFTVRIGTSTSAKIQLSWEMLETCYAGLATVDGYSGSYFRQHFPQKARVHPCHVSAVGQIFEAAGIGVRSDANGRRKWHLRPI